jgi:GTP-binding protein HflX
LVQAFRSTLEQATEADIILNVCDSSSPEAPVHLDVARRLLTDLGCAGRPVIPVLNKCDLIPDLGQIPMIGQAVRVSAKTGEGLNQLLASIENNLQTPSMKVRLLLPFTETGLEAKIRKSGNVESEEYTEDGFVLTASIPPGLSGALSRYVIE